MREGAIASRAKRRENRVRRVRGIHAPPKRTALSRKQKGETRQDHLSDATPTIRETNGVSWFLGVKIDPIYWCYQTAAALTNRAAQGAHPVTRAKRHWAVR